MWQQGNLLGVWSFICQVSLRCCHPRWNEDCSSVSSSDSLASAGFYTRGLSVSLGSDVEGARWDGRSQLYDACCSEDLVQIIIPNDWHRPGATRLEAFKKDILCLCNIKTAKIATAVKAWGCCQKNRSWEWWSDAQRPELEMPEKQIGNGERVS